LTLNDPEDFSSCLRHLIFFEIFETVGVQPAFDPRRLNGLSASAFKLLNQYSDVLVKGPTVMQKSPKAIARTHCVYTRRMAEWGRV